MTDHTAPALDLPAIRERDLETYGKWSYWHTQAAEAVKDRRALLAHVADLERDIAEHVTDIEALWRTLEAASADVGRLHSALLTERGKVEHSDAASARLREGLLTEACSCGPTDPDPAVHAEGCPYRVWSMAPETEAQSDAE